MIIIADRNGQLGNRLSTFANFIGLGIENNVSVANPGFRDYAKYFVGTFSDPWCRYPPRTVSPFDSISKQVLYPPIFFAARHARTFNIRTRWLNTQNSRGDVFQLGPNTADLLSSKVTLFRGWQFRDDPALRKHRDAICTFFTPRSAHLDNVCQRIEKVRAHCDILVGVHIRRGDYKNHLNGRYYYGYDIYRDMMEKVKKIWKHSDIGFLICSNEPVPEAEFKDYNFAFGPNHVVEDMYALAACDYLIGPPSTYTIWASYYGKVPLFQMALADADPNLADFVRF